MTVKIRHRKRKTSTSIMLDYTANGKRVQRVFGRASTLECLERIMELAAIEAKAIELALLKASYINGVEKLHIKDAFTEFLFFHSKTTAAEATKKAYENTCATFLDWCGNAMYQVQEIEPYLGTAFIKYRTAQGKAPGTVKGDVTRLSRIWKRLVEQGHCESNPWRHSDVVAVTPAAGRHERAFTEGELQRLLISLDLSWGSHNESIREFFFLLSETGLRSGELLNLRYCTVSCHDESPWISVEPYNGWTPKTRKSIRRIPISPAASQVIYSRSRVSGDDEYVFPRYWTTAFISKRLKTELRLANLDARDARYGQKLRVHSLRHYYATKLVTGGVDVATIRDLLGHASIETTNRYFNAPPEAAVAAVKTVFGRQK